MAPGGHDPGTVVVSPWVLIYDGFDPAHESHREAMCALGNGYMAARGAASEAAADGVHYPGTYLAGIYNRLTSRVAGRRVEHEHMVNVPNWAALDVRAGPGWLSAGSEDGVAERRELDLRRGVLTRSLEFRDADGRRTRITQQRLVSMARPHVAALRTTIVAENWSGPVLVRAGLDGRVVNANVDTDRMLANHHLVALTAEEVGPNTILVEAQTSQSQVHIAEAARVTAADTGGRRYVGGVVSEGAAFVAEEITGQLRPGEALVVDKVVAVTTSRDPAIASARLAALAELDRAPGFDSLLEEHERAWANLWDRFAIDADTDAATSLLLNLQVFHLLQSVSPNAVGLDAGVPARGLHGEGYLGHVFWDELFVFPLLNLRLPALTRSLLLYRWRRLDAARDAARTAGMAGALFPWQSGSDGREETPGELFNPRSGRWMRDNSHLQRHVALAVAYNVWQYYQVTADVEFMTEYGAELMIEVARLFAGLATLDEADDRYDIAGVMGPDEYHDGYPEIGRASCRERV